MECAISFWSHQLTSSEQKYSVTEKEALTAVSAVEEIILVG